jgi:hypothetical protein
MNFSLDCRRPLPVRGSVQPQHPVGHIGFGGLPRCPATVLALQAILQLAVVATNILNQTAPVTHPYLLTAAGLCLAMTRGQTRAEQRGKGKWHMNHVPWLDEAQAFVAAQIDNERENAMKTAHEGSRSGEGKETSSRQTLSRRDILAGSGGVGTIMMLPKPV